MLFGLNRLLNESAFDPQRGLRGDKQDNTIESLDFPDPQRSNNPIGRPVEGLTN